MNWKEFIQQLPNHLFAVQCKDSPGYTTVFWKKYPNGLPKYTHATYETVLQLEKENPNEDNDM